MLQSRVSGSNVADNWCSSSCSWGGSGGEDGSSTRASLRERFAGLWWGDAFPNACIANRTILILLLLNFTLHLLLVLFVLLKCNKTLHYMPHASLQFIKALSPFHRSYMKIIHRSKGYINPYLIILRSIHYPTTCSAWHPWYLFPAHILTLMLTFRIHNHPIASNFSHGYKIVILNEK